MLCSPSSHFASLRRLFYLGAGVNCWLLFFQPRSHRAIDSTHNSKGKMQSSFMGSSLHPSTRKCFAPARFSPVASRVVAHYGGRVNLGGGKPWERTEVNQNGNPVKIKMHVKKGDTVQVVAGKDKGTVAEVEKVIPTRGLVVVKGVNITVRNIAPRTKDEQGQQKRQESPIHHSNVMHYSTVHQRRSRVGHKITADGRKVRYLIKTGEELQDRSLKAPAADTPTDTPAGGDASSA